MLGLAVYIKIKFVYIVQQNVFPIALLRSRTVIIGFQ